LTRAQAQWFFIEHRFREIKSTCVRTNYSGPPLECGYHHMAVVMLATLFILKQKIQE